MKTLYVSDLDSTLLTSNDRISEHSIMVINGLVQKGMLFTYATARSLVSASVVTRGLRTDIPVICYNGCLIIRPQNHEVLFSVGFEQSEADFIIRQIKRFHLSPLVYAYIDGIEKVSWLPERENEGMKRYLSLRTGDRRLNPVSEELELYRGQLFYFTCIGEKEELQEFYETVKADGRFTCTLQQELYRTEYWCEVMPEKATKANAILTLKNLWRCDRVISFGDAANDLPMFTVSDECYAVENAVSELKENATGIIPGCNYDGVADWLKLHAEF